MSIKIRTWDGWMRSANATSVLCHPPLTSCNTDLEVYRFVERRHVLIVVVVGGVVTVGVVELHGRVVVLVLGSEQRRVGAGGVGQRRRLRAVVVVVLDAGIGAVDVLSSDATIDVSSRQNDALSRSLWALISRILLILLSATGQGPVLKNSTDSFFLQKRI